MLKQFLQYKLSQKLSPQQIQLMKLIELPTQAFEQRLKQELEENPALESGKEQEDNYEDEFQKDEDQRNYIVSNKKILNTGYVTKFSLDDGIKELIEGYKGINIKSFRNY